LHRTNPAQKVSTWGIERELDAFAIIKYLTIVFRCAMTEGMLYAEKILITGATGMIAFPIARALPENRRRAARSSRMNGTAMRCDQGVACE
jgi:NADPH:quinone reductase-like Zn-dependent oxidoreductase